MQSFERCKLSKLRFYTAKSILGRVNNCYMIAKTTYGIAIDGSFHSNQNNYSTDFSTAKSPILPNFKYSLYLLGKM